MDGRGHVTIAQHRQRSDDHARSADELTEALADLPSAKESPFSSILHWYKGVSRAKAEEALVLLDASIEAGSWLPGRTSQRVWAALGKTNVAKKILLNSHYTANHAEHTIYYAAKYGDLQGLARLDLREATRELDDDCLQFYTEFRPVVDAMKRLDVTRPKPVFTVMNASPTVSAELKRQGAASVEVCPIKYEMKKIKGQDGHMEHVPVAILLWPEGTLHGTSRYAHGTPKNDQCEACGHAIRNRMNWVPLVLTTKNGQKKSLWVGRDCAKTLFGVDMSGDLELKE